MDQWRADAFAEVLLSGTGTAGALESITATVSVVIPAAALIGDRSDEGREEPACLADGTLVDLETVRALAGAAGDLGAGVHPPSQRCRSCRRRLPANRCSTPLVATP